MDDFDGKPGSSRGGTGSWDTPGHEPRFTDLNPGAEGTPLGQHGDSTPSQTPGGFLGYSPAKLGTPSRTPARSASATDGDSSDSDSDDGLNVHNPEPPAELLDQQLIDADNIGNTVFSKHWVFSTLMKLIKAIEKKEAGSNPSADLDLDEELQDEMCKLWDMSMNQEVANFLLEFNALDILTGVISKSKVPRATEICVGILGNLACNAKALEKMTSDRELRAMLLFLLENPDAPTLVETMRLWRVCLTGEEEQSQRWLQAIKDDETAFVNVCFIMQSSTNGTLLKNTAEFIDKILDADEELCEKWSTSDFVYACLEATKQIGFADMETLDVVLHILQLVSTCETGIQSLLSHVDEVCQLSMTYLSQVCSEDILVIEGIENTLGSVISVMGAVFTAWEDKMTLLATDYQLLRCVLKILQVIYAKYHKLPDPRPPHQPQGRRRRTTSQGSEIIDSHPGGAGDGHSNMEEGDEAAPDKPDSTTATKDGAHKDGDLTENLALRTDSYDETITQMLYEVVQNFISDIIAAITENIPTVNGDSSAHNGRASHQNGDDGPSSSVDAVVPVFAPVPRSLSYMETGCERQRLKYMIHTVKETEEGGAETLIPALLTCAENYRLTRLASIIRETPSTVT